MRVADFSPLANHLWQSTLFVGVVALLVLLLKRNRADLRHWLWLIASAKFLVPFAVFVAIGHQFGWRSESIAQPDLAFMIHAIGQPFTRPAFAVAASPVTGFSVALPLFLSAIWFSGCAMHLWAWWVRWRRFAVAVRDASPVNDGRELDSLRRLEKSVGLHQSISLVSSDTSLEPGIFGIIKPVLLWPRSISVRLTDDQLEGILAHELFHARRRDNLAAAVHMIVEAAFWFYPPVWWIEKRLVDERERACDEEVIRLGIEPQVYAEGILKTCEFYAESPLICVAGVTGSDLKKRIEAIMKRHSGEELNAWKRLLLVTVGAVTLATPIIIGVLNAPQVRAESQAARPGPPTFETASVKPNKSGDNRVVEWLQPDGRYTATSVTLRMLIRHAFRLQDSQVLGGPNWIGSDRYDVVANGDGQFSLMLQALLKDRFKLAFHNEQRDLPIYALVLDSSDKGLGPQLRPSDCPVENAAPTGTPGPKQQAPCDSIQTGEAHLTFRGAPMSQIATGLSLYVDRVVLDRSGLTGRFDAALDWPPETTGGMFTALQEQLGLKLEATRGPVDVVVIDSASQPTP
jgi:bla regulator protein blaR1